MEPLVVLGLTAGFIIWGVITLNSRVIGAASKKFRENSVDPDSAGEASRAKLFTAVLVLHHLLLGAIVVISEPRVEDGYIYQLVTGFYTAAQFIFLWFLKSVSEKHPAVNRVFQVGLLMLSISLVLLLAFNWGTMSKQGLLFQLAVFRSQLYLTALTWLLTISAALFWWRFPARPKKREQTRSLSRSLLKPLALACGALTLCLILLWATTGYYVRPRPFNEPIKAHHMGQMSLMVPQIWETSSWRIRASLPGLSYFEMTETRFADLDQSEEGFDPALKDFFKYAGSKSEDLSHIIGRPALMAEYGIPDEAKGFCGLTFMMIVKFDRGYIAMSADWMNSRDPDGQRFKRPWPCSFTTGNRILDEAEINERKSTFIETVKNFLANYHWAEADSPPNSSSFKTRYGYISSDLELEQLYSKVYFQNPAQKHWSTEDELSVMTGVGLSNRDKTGLVTGSTTLNKIDRASIDLFFGRRNFFSLNPKTLDGRKGTEFIQGWQPLFSGNHHDRRALKLEFAWYDDPDDPQTVVMLQRGQYEAENIDLEAEKWAGLWQAITDSLCFIKP